jgi:hypothetical protein
VPDEAGAPRPPSVDAGAPHVIDAGSSCSGTGCATEPVDPICGPAPTCRTPSVFPAAVTLDPPSVPVACANGWELGDATGGGASYTIRTTSGGALSEDVPLDIDFASYLVPDGSLVGAIDASGTATIIFNTCRIQTWTSGDPTGGRSRPPDTTIRQFHATVPAGTTSLSFTFGATCSPMYMRVLGLCDFTFAAPNPSISETWRSCSASQMTGSNWDTTCM